jgi:hypothetical protein
LGLRLITGRLTNDSSRHSCHYISVTKYYSILSLLFFTGGASLVVGLASAGIGAKISYDSSEDCERASEKLRENAKTFRHDVAMLSGKRDELKLKKKNLSSSFSLF